MKNYKVKQEDLIDQLEGFPIEVVQKMVDEQVRQGNKADVSVFQNNPCANLDDYGFDWEGSKDGNKFWKSIIDSEEFIKFFNKYQKSKEENNSYKYYFKGCKDSNKIVPIIADKLPQILNVGSHKCNNEHHIYFFLEDCSLCHCGLGAEYLLKQLGYEEVKYEPETVEYNGKKYIKSDFESAINHLKEVEG